jgi:hypothetical protein
MTTICPEHTLHYGANVEKSPKELPIETRPEKIRLEAKQFQVSPIANNLPWRNILSCEP